MRKTTAQLIDEALAPKIWLEPDLLDEPKPESHACDICGDPTAHLPHKALLTGETVWLCDICEQRNWQALQPVYNEHKHGPSSRYLWSSPPEDRVRDL
jgi:hypothetical protein